MFLVLLKTNTIIWKEATRALQRGLLLDLAYLLLMFSPYFRTSLKRFKGFWIFFFNSSFIVEKSRENIGA